MSELDKVINEEIKQLAPPAEEKEITNNNPTPEQVAEKPKKPRKKRAPMSEEHKAKCRASLAKAREASKAKRQKNAYVKRLKKKEEEKAKDDEIKKKILAEDNNNEKDKEIARLKKQLESLTLQDVVKKPKKPKEPLPTINEVEEVVPDVPTNKLPTEQPKNIEMKIEKVAPPEEPVVIPEPVNDIKENHNNYKEKTKQLQKNRRYKRRKGMARYGRK